MPQDPNTPDTPAPPEMTLPEFIDAYGDKLGVPKQLRDSIFAQESNWNHYNPDGSVKVSKKGARGVGQLMPDTARSLGVKNIDDPIENAAGALRLQKQLYDKYLTAQGDPNEAALLAGAAYNAGEGAVDKFNGVPKYSETQTYAKKLAEALKANPIQAGGGPPAIQPAIQQPAPTAPITIPQAGTRLRRTTDTQPIGPYEPPAPVEATFTPGGAALVTPGQKLGLQAGKPPSSLAGTPVTNAPVSATITPGQGYITATAPGELPAGRERLVAPVIQKQLEQIKQQRRQQQRQQQAEQARAVITANDAAWHFGATPAEAQRLNTQQRTLLAQAVAEDQRKRASGQEIQPPTLEYQNQMRARAGLKPLTLNQRMQTQRVGNIEFQTPLTEKSVSPYYQPTPGELPQAQAMEQRGGFRLPQQNFTQQAAQGQRIYESIPATGPLEQKGPFEGLPPTPEEYARNPQKYGIKYRNPTQTDLQNTQDRLANQPFLLRTIGQHWPRITGEVQNQLANVIENNGGPAAWLAAPGLGVKQLAQHIGLAPEPPQIKQIADYLRNAAAINQQIANYKTPEDEGSTLKWFVKGGVNQVYDLGMIGLKMQVTGLPFPIIMAGDAALNYADKGPVEQAKQMAIAYATGRAIELLPAAAQKALAKVPGGFGDVVAAHPEIAARAIGGTTFGTIAGAGTALAGGSTQQIAGSAGAGAVLGFGLSGSGLRAVPKEVVDYAMKSPLTPEGVKDVMANVVQYGKGLIRSTDGRNLSLYSNPKTGEVFGSEITPEQAKEYDPTIITGTKRSVRNAKEVSPEEYDDLARTLGIETKTAAKQLPGEVPPKVEPVPEVKNVTPPKETKPEPKPKVEEPVAPPPVEVPPAKPPESVSPEGTEAAKPEPVPPTTPEAPTTEATVPAIPVKPQGKGGPTVEPTTRPEIETPTPQNQAPEGATPPAISPKRVSLKVRGVQTEGTVVNERNNGTIYDIDVGGGRILKGIPATSTKPVGGEVLPPKTERPPSGPARPPLTPTKPPTTPTPPPTVTTKPELPSDAQKALERMREAMKKRKPVAGMPKGAAGMPEPDEYDITADGALVGHELFKSGIRDQATWAQQMEEMVGPEIKPDLPDIWEASVIHHENQGGDISDLPEWKAPKLEPKPEAKPAPEPEESKALVKGTNDLITRLKDRLATGANTDWRDLDKMADLSFGGSRAEGKYTPRDMYDAMETALTETIQHSKAIAAMDPKAALQSLRAMMSRLPTQTSRQDEQIQRQQFSTPPTIGYVAAKALDIRPDDVALEPSAGTGMLSGLLKAMGAKEVHVNEISPRRTALLERQGYKSVNGVDAQRINALLDQKIRPSIILMNPPFSTQEGIERHKTEYGFEHMLSALQRLQDGGRLVAIMGESAKFDRQTNGPMWDKILSRYNVRANIAIPGKEYGKFGTTFGTQLIVIDKVGPTEGGSLAERMKNVYQLAPGDLEGVLDAIGDLPKRGSLAEGGRGNQPATGEQPGREGEDLGSGERPGVRGPTKPPETTVGPQPTGETSPKVSPPAGEGVKPSGETPESTSGRGGERVEPSGPTEPSQPEEDTGVTTTTEGATTESESEIFVQYKPAKLRGGKEHPGRIVESSSMAAVEPPDITYKPNLPASVIKKGVLSDLQLEAVTYSGQRHSQHLPDGRRAAHFTGDGTGVGKGRIAMGIALDNWRTWTQQKKKRRILYLSVNYDLVESAERDMKALLELPDEANLAEHFPFHVLNDYSPGDLLDELVGDGMMFSSYATFIATGQGGTSRYKDLTEWLGDDGLIILDEAHKAKNAVTDIGHGTQTGERVIEVQQANPNWKFEYMSATGATEVRNMAYMDRLGLWGDGLSFPDFTGFQAAIDAGGLGAMEMVARDMKALGMYRAVSLSYKGVTYRNLTHELTDGQEEVYNAAARAWQMVQQKVEEAMIDQRPNSRTRSLILSQFYSGQQRFFRQVLTAMKLPTVIGDVEKVLREGVDYEDPDTGQVKHLPVQVILGFIYTGESQMSREVRQAQASGASLEDLDFSPAHILRGYVERWFPTQLFTDVPIPGGQGTRREPVFDDDGNPVHDPVLLAIKREVLAELESLTLPENPLDQIINHFGEGSVAEMSGRSNRMIRDPETGLTEYRPRLGTERSGRRVSRKRANEHEMEDFQSGEKKIAVITDAASTGITLSSDLTKPSKNARRIHYTVETAWSADKMMQTLGRGHRTNQASEPEMVLSGTNVGGEARFLATIAKRMGSLGALSKGERKSSGATFDNYDFENQYGLTTARTILDVMSHGGGPPGVEDFDGLDVARKMGFTKRNNQGNLEIPQRTIDSLDVGKFLNRVLALELPDQKVMFDWFIGQLDHIIADAKATGAFDTGIADIKGDSVRQVGEAQVVARDQTTGAASHHVVVEADEPVDKVEWDWVERMSRAQTRATDPGTNRLWLQKHSHNVIYTLAGSKRTDPSSGITTQYYHVYRPGGLSDTLISYSELVDKYDPVKADTIMPVAKYKPHKLPAAQVEAQMRLKAQVAQASGKPPAEPELPQPQTVREWWNKEYLESPGFKTKTFHLITSPVIPIWERLTTRDSHGNATRLKAMRATTDTGKRLVGIHIPTRAINKVLKALGVGASTRTPEEIFNAIYLDGEQVELVGGMKLRRTMLRGSRAIELWGVDRNQAKVIEGMGVVKERKGMGTDIYLVPTDAAKGIPVIEKLLARWPPFDATAAASAEPLDLSEGEGGAAGMPADLGGLADAAANQGGASAESQLEAEQQYIEEASKVDPPDECDPEQEDEDLEDLADRAMARVTGIRDWDIRAQPESGYKNVTTSTADVRAEFLKMFRAIGHATDIRAGRMGRYKNALGLTFAKSQIIRLRNAWNIPVMAHEAGHALQAAVYGHIYSKAIKHLPIAVRRELIKLGKDLYGSTNPAGGYTAEGFAEFMRYYLTTEEAPARAPNMLDYLENTILKDNPALAQALPKVRKKIDEYRFQGALNRDQAQTESGRRDLRKRAQTVLKEMKDAATDWVDELTPLLRSMNEVESLTGKKFAGASNFYKLADAWRGMSNGALRYMLEDGMIDGNWRKTGPSFKQAVAGPISGLGKRLGYWPEELFAKYIKALRAIERHSPYVLGGEETGGAGMFTKLERDPFGRLRPIPKQPKQPGMTLADALTIKEAIEQEAPEVQIAAAGWYQWNDGFMNHIMEVNPDLAPVLRRQMLTSGYYAPLNRAFDELDEELNGRRGARGMATRSGKLIGMKGSERRVINPLNQFILNSERMLSNAYKRRVLLAMMQLEREQGVGSVFERVPRSMEPHVVSIDQLRKALEDIGIDTSGAQGDELLTYFTPMTVPGGNDPIMAIFQGGKISHWVWVPAELYNSLTGMQVYRPGWVFDLLAGRWTRMFRLGTTGLRASFSLFTNPMRDVFTWYAQAQTSTKNPIARLNDYLHGMASVAGWLITHNRAIAKGGKLDELGVYYDLFKRLNVSMSQPLGNDIAITRHEIKRLFRPEGVKEIAAHPIRRIVTATPIDFLRELLGFPEAFPRIAEMRAAMRDVGFDPDKPDTLNLDQAIEIALAGKQSTVDFLAMGRKGKAVNQAVPFFNANIQGARSFLRAFKRNPLRALMAGLSLTGLTLLLWRLNRDKDWYKGLKAYERFAFWNIQVGNEVFQIPRPQEFGTTFASLPEALADAAYRDDPEGLKDVGLFAADVLTPPILPVIPRLGVEQAANWNEFFSRPIVSKGLIDKPGVEQQNEYTSELAKFIAQQLPDARIPYLNIPLNSPMRIDAAARELFGGLGGDLINAPRTLKATGGAIAGVTGQKGDYDLSDLPVFGRAFRRGGTEGGQSIMVDRFYDKLTEARMNQQTKNAAFDRKAGPGESEQERTARLNLEAASVAMHALRKAAENADTTAQRREIYHQINDIAERAYKGEQVYQPKKERIGTRAKREKAETKRENKAVQRWLPRQQ